MNPFLNVINSFKEFAKPYKLVPTIELVGSEFEQNRPPEGLFYRDFSQEGKTIRFTIVYKKNLITNESVFLQTPILEAIEKKYIVLSATYAQDDFFKIYTLNIETLCQD
jgi:hypothetical protein